MKPVRTETTNAVYTLEGCNDLPVTKYENVDNKEMGVESCWELDAEDLNHHTLWECFMMCANWMTT